MMDVQKEKPVAEGLASRDALHGQVRESLARVEERVRALRRSNRRLIYLSLGASALATVMAGLASATGPLLGEGGVAWRWTCGAIAVLTACSTLFTTVHQRLDVTEHLAQARACAGRLHALELALTVTGRAVPEVARDYEEVVSTYREFMYG